MIEQLEQQLDSFDAAQRNKALSILLDRVKAGEIELPQAGDWVNLHCHTFFSYNAYGYSPSKFAWLARKVGLAVAGTVDFDVLDALEEFHAARRLLSLKGSAGIETRVFVPEFSTRVINSPGEPGISYHMGVGFPSEKVPQEQEAFLSSLKDMAQTRNQELMQRVNAFLAPVELDYDSDVLTLTPAGNATERHMCLAYARKAVEVVGQDQALVDFWTEKLGDQAASIEMPESRDLLNLIRAKTMKRGGVGYVQPDSGSFPLMADMNRFILACGAMPTHTWLDGTSDGEKDIEELLDVGMETGVVAMNIIPDRNYTTGRKDQKLQNLYDVVEIAKRRNLVIIAGTEMNSPGQKFVDSFETPELSPLLPVFAAGAHIVYAHAVLQRECGLGYTSRWAEDRLPDRAERNRFYQTLGETMAPDQETNLAGLSEMATPEEILEQAGE